MTDSLLPCHPGLAASKAHEDISLQPHTGRTLPCPALPWSPRPLSPHTPHSCEPNPGVRGLSPGPMCQEGLWSSIFSDWMLTSFVNLADSEATGRHPELCLPEGLPEEGNPFLCLLNVTGHATILIPCLSMAIDCASF